MKIEHVGLFVRDLESMRAFYETYFGARAGEKYHNVRTGFQSYFLTFETGARLEIATRPEISGENAIFQVGFIHLAFALGSVAAVNDLTEKLRQDDYQIISEPRTTGDGYYESVVLDPEGNQLELTV